MVTALWRRVVCVTRATISDRSFKLLRLSSAIVGFNQSVSETNKYGGKSHGNYQRTCQTHKDERTYETRTDSRGPAVACLLACHNRQPADQRDGPGNGPAVSGGHR